MNHFKIPHKPFEWAVRGLRTAVSTFQAIDGEIAELEPVSLETHGKYGMEERQAILDGYEKKRREASASALKSVETAREMWRDAFEKLVMPDGGDMERPDFKLLELHLLQTPEELRAVLNRHADSELFRRMGDRYAEKEGWDGFKNLSTAPAIERFADFLLYYQCKPP